MKRAIVHIGFPKTGSTSIQRSLAGSREHLRRNGILYPGDGDAQCILAGRFHPDGLSHKYVQNCRVENPRLVIDQMLKEIADWDGDLILSSEYFHDIGKYGALEIAGFLGVYNYEITYVCYLRHPVDAAVSSAQQSVKMGRRSLQEVVEAPTYTPMKENLLPILSVSGRDSIIVKSFEISKQDGLARDFLKSIGKTDLAADLVELYANESISMDGVILADAHRRHLEVTGEKIFQIINIFYWRIKV